MEDRLSYFKYDLVCQHFRKSKIGIANTVFYALPLYGCFIRYTIHNVATDGREITSMRYLVGTCARAMVQRTCMGSLAASRNHRRMNFGRTQNANLTPDKPQNRLRTCRVYSRNLLQLMHVLYTHS